MGVTPFFLSIEVRKSKDNRLEAIAFRFLFSLSARYVSSIFIWVGF